MLATIDVGNTLGTFHKPDCIRVLATIAEKHNGAKKSMVAEVCRWFLHIAPVLTDKLIADVCHYLMIPRHAWPDPIRSGFTAYPYADKALTEIRMLAPVVAISNVSILSGPDRMADLDTQLGDHLSGIYASYAIGIRKPHPRAWHYAAARLGATVADIIHIGDRLPEDICGALHAGCRAAILTNTRQIDVPAHLHDDPQIAVVPDLQAAVTVLSEWRDNPPSLSDRWIHYQSRVGE